MSDPICGMEVDEESAAGKCEYGGKTYLFCCQPCSDKFKSNPAQYKDGAVFRIVTLTGDNRTTAEAIARQLGIDEVYAEVLPEQTGDIVRQLQSQGRTVAMAGAGISVG